MFADPDALVDLYERLPATFEADDLTRRGLTDGRRHLVLRHLAEHPDFPCELVCRQPLTAEKREGAEISDG